MSVFYIHKQDDVNITLSSDTFRTSFFHILRCGYHGLLNLIFQRLLLKPANSLAILCMYVQINSSTSQNWKNDVLKFFSPVKQKSVFVETVEYSGVHTSIRILTCIRHTLIDKTFSTVKTTSLSYSQLKIFNE